MRETLSMCRSCNRRKKLGVLVAVLFGVGCSSGSSAGPDGGKDLSSFIGTWTANSGTITLTCSGKVTTAQVTGNDVWQMGSTSDLLQPAAASSSGCVVLANVSGSTATGLPNQTCALPMGAMTVNLTIAMYTFVLGSNGTTATESASGSGSVTTNGSTGTCTYAETATYTKA
jgi:hypothetical protein